jgi:hypothetical protein
MAKNVTFDFQFDLPDEYLMQTNDLELKGTWTYSGQEKFYIFINKEDGSIDISSGKQFYDTRDPEGSAEKAAQTAGQARVALLITAVDEPVIASLFTEPVDGSSLPQKEYKVPGDDKVYYSRSDPTYPDHTYEVPEIRYDLNAQQFIKPFPWKKPHMTEEQHNGARLRIIEGIVRDLADEELDYSDEMRAKLLTFKEELEAIPTKFAGWKPWMIPFPDDPRFVQPE